MVPSAVVDASYQPQTSNNPLNQDFILDCILRKALFPRRPPVTIGNVLSLEQYLGTKWAEYRLGLIKVRSHFSPPFELPKLRRVLDELDGASPEQASWEARTYYILSMLFSGDLHGINYGPFAQKISEQYEVVKDPRSLFSRCFQNGKGELVIPWRISRILYHAGVIPELGTRRDDRSDFIKSGLRLKKILNSSRLPSLQSVFDYYEARLERPLPFEIPALASLIRNVSALSGKGSGFAIRLDSKKRAVLSPDDGRASGFIEDFALDFDSVYFEHLRRFTPLYMSSADLESMGLIDSGVQETILSRVSQGRILGFIQDRETALANACLHAHEFGVRIRYTSGMLLEPADELSRFLSSRELPPVTNADEQYTIRRFELRTRKQLDDDADLPVNAVHQGNYAYLISACEGNEDLMFRLFGMLSEGEVSSVPEMEAMLHNLTSRNELYGGRLVAPEKLRIVEKAPALYAVIKRIWDKLIPQIDVPFGLQAQNHAGYGISHVLYQRKLDGTFGGESSPFSSQEEFLESLLHSLGTARFYSVSERLPETHLILKGEAYPGGRGSFVFVIASKSGKFELITAYISSQETAST